MGNILSGKQILITGGSGQLGCEFVKACMNEGASVLTTCRSSEKAQRLEVDFEGLSALPLDLSCEAGLDEFCTKMKEIGFSPDVLVNCARSIDSLGVNDGVPPWKNWVAEYEIDVVAPYTLAVKLKDELSKSGKGTVINISSMYGITAVNKGLYEDPEWMSPIHYSTAKAAQIHLSREMAVRFAEDNIRVNTISYGGIEGRVDDEFKRRYSMLCPSGGMLQVEDLAGALVFLASDAASGVNGHNMVVDGGWTTW